MLRVVCEGGDGHPSVCMVLVRGGRVNQADEGLGQPRQVMTAGTHGPSRQLMFDSG